MGSFLSSFSSWHLTTLSRVFCLILHSRHGNSFVERLALHHYQEDSVISPKQPCGPWIWNPTPPCPPALLLYVRAGRPDFTQDPTTLPAPYLHHLSWVTGSEMKNDILRSLLVLPLMGSPFRPKNIRNQLTFLTTGLGLLWMVLLPQRSTFFRGDFWRQSTDDFASSQVLPDLVDQDNWTNATPSVAFPAPENGWPGGPRAHTSNGTEKALGVIRSLHTVELLLLHGRTARTATGGSAHKDVPSGTEQAQPTVLIHRNCLQTLQLLGFPELMHR